MKKPGDSSLTGTSYNFYKIEKNEMNEFRKRISIWASNHEFTEILKSEYPLKLEKQYADSSSSSVILEPVESYYYKLRDVINFSGSKSDVIEINERFMDDMKSLSEAVEPFYISPHQVPTSR